MTQIRPNAASNLSTLRPTVSTRLFRGLVNMRPEEIQKKAHELERLGNDELDGLARELHQMNPADRLAVAKQMQTDQDSFWSAAMAGVSRVLGLSERHLDFNAAGDLNSASGGPGPMWQADFDTSTGKPTEFQNHLFGVSDRFGYDSRGRLQSLHHTGWDYKADSQFQYAGTSNHVKTQRVHETADGKTADVEYDGDTEGNLKSAHAAIHSDSGDAIFNYDYATKKLSRVRTGPDGTTSKEDVDPTNQYWLNPSGSRFIFSDTSEI